MTKLTTRSRTLTAWQLYDMLRTEAHRQQLDVGLVWCCAVPGTLERKPGGYDFNAASVAVWYGNRRVYAMADCGDCGLMLYYDAAHPTCEVEVVPDGAALTVVEET